ncbi:MAG: hypothetical protein JWN86_4575 [Planctomycetota bacterium]|nr:hypothetical protein [Planctomycetota bacterium]
MQIGDRPIGLVASLNRSLRSRRILGFLPANLIVVIVLAGVCVISSIDTLTSFRCDREPRAVGLEKFFADVNRTNRHVELTGIVVPEASLVNRASNRGENGPVQSVHVPMIAPDGKAALLVKFPGDLGRGEARRITVSGMLAPPEAGVSRALERRGWTIGGIPVERRFVLIAGARPHAFWIPATLSIISGSWVFALLASEWRDLALIRGKKAIPGNPSGV